MVTYKRVGSILILATSVLAFTIQAAKTASFMDTNRTFPLEAGSRLYQVRFNHTGQKWTHADVAGIRIRPEKPIAILPMQYSDPSPMQPGAMVGSKQLNTIIQRALARRLEARELFVLTTSITQHGEDVLGFQPLEHFIAGLHKGNANAQAILTADTHIRNVQNPKPGAQMLVTGTNDRNHEWEVHLQKYMVSV